MFRFTEPSSGHIQDKVLVHSAIELKHVAEFLILITDICRVSY